MMFSLSSLFQPIHKPCTTMLYSKYTASADISPHLGLHNNQIFAAACHRYVPYGVFEMDM